MTQAQVRRLAGKPTTADASVVGVGADAVREECWYYGNALEGDRSDAFALLSAESLSVIAATAQTPTRSESLTKRRAPLIALRTIGRRSPQVPLLWPPLPDRPWPWPALDSYARRHDCEQNRSLPSLRPEALRLPQLAHRETMPIGTSSLGGCRDRHYLRGVSASHWFWRA
jgi:hypothetical protein